MSIKVYTGKKFIGTFEDFQSQLLKIKTNEKFISLLNQKINQIFESDINNRKSGFIKHSNKNNIDNLKFTEKFSKFILNNIDDPDFEFSKYIDKDEINIYKNHYNRFNLSIFFKSIKNVIYCIVNSNDKEIIELISKELNLIDYYFWNNCDKPEEISNNDWKIRSNIWSFENDWDNCFCFDVFNFSANFKLFFLTNKIIS